MPQPAKKPVLSVEHQIQLADLHREIEILRDNHLAHMADDIDDLKTELTNSKTEFNQRFDRLDDRLWVLVGLTATTLLGIVVSMVFGS